MEETKGLIEIDLREAFPIIRIEDLQEAFFFYAGSTHTERSLSAIISNAALFSQ